jgi:hypothetical protein
VNKSDIALVVSAVSLLISASIFYLHLRRYRSETKPHLKVSLKRTKDQFEVRALNPSRGPIVIESFGFKAAGKQFAIRMYHYSSGSQIPFPNSVKLKQNEAHVEKIGTTELSAILEEELNLKGAFGVRSLFVDSQSKVWKSAETMSINTEEWWPPENGRQQMDRYGDQRWRNITVIE